MSETLPINHQRVINYQTIKANKSCSSDAPSSSGNISPTTMIHFSQRSKELLIAIGHAANAPEVRMDKVAHYQQAIANGTYMIETDKIADKLVG
jgi:flagellar biosynthesis anti-sigma factor FlgM